MRIFVLSNSSKGLDKFRKELLQKLIEQKIDIYISVPRDESTILLEQMGCKHIETHIDRRGKNIKTDLNLIKFYISTIRRIMPCIVLTYTIKPNIYGGIACRTTNTPYIANVTGLGTSIENKGITQKISLFLYKIGLKKASCVFFQNEANRRFFVNNNMVIGKSRLIPGSGVNLQDHNFEDYPDNDKCIHFLFVGRIMKDKGIDELLQAACIVKERCHEVQFDLVGECEENYTERLSVLENQGVIKYHGHQDDVHSFIKRSHATILPSYHEGTANVLLESASSGRPILASKVPGCIETFDDGISGIGFDVRSVDGLVEAVMTFINLPLEKKKAMGLAGRKKMEKEYSREIVIKAYLEEIDKIRKSKEY